MSEARNRRRSFFANKMHKEVFFIVFLAALLPTIITAVFLYYLIFYITTQEIGIPETIARHIIPAARQVSTILWITVPVVIGIILFIAYKVTHQIVGPFDRIVRELGESISGPVPLGKPIRLRENDKFRPLVEKINILLDKWSQK